MKEYEATLNVKFAAESLIQAQKALDTFLSIMVSSVENNLHDYYCDTLALGCEEADECAEVFDLGVEEKILSV